MERKIFQTIDQPTSAIPPDGTEKIAEVLQSLKYSEKQK